jgi:hypothetical protein
MPMMPGLPPFQRPGRLGGRRHVSPETAEWATKQLAQMEAEDRWLNRWIPRFCYLVAGLVIIALILVELGHI